MAAPSLPLNPTFTFKHISVHMVHILARLAAKRLVQEQLRADGLRVSLVKSVGVDIVPINAGNAGEVERAITDFARSPNGGLIVTSSARVSAHADLIVALAASHRLPTVYHRRSFAAAGGLISYGANTVELARLATGYVDRILRGEKPADLPVQAPTKYELVINLKTAKALGLTIPSSVLARADEVID